MSFNKRKETIDEGDTVVLYFSPNNKHSIKVVDKIKNKKGEMVEKVFQTTYGALKVISLVGTKYGSKVELSKGWGYVIQPTPDLWTLTLPHRTQIIYAPDISMIIFLLDLKPGSIVVETGTGSGSLSHSLIQTIRPTGHLYTFDFHEQRAQIARDEFKSHGICDYVTVTHRDVCANGFGNELNHKADAVFLDLPHPWLTVDHAVDVLKESGGKLCSFSPCIEQVQRTCTKLTECGFVELKTYECLQRELSVQQKHLTVLDLDSTKNKDSLDPANFEKKEETKIATVTHSTNVPGHTGFVTIATLPPLFARRVERT